MFLQAKLLRALQEKEIRPVGSTQQIPIRVRVIAATNRNLEEAVRAGTFRQDLHFRLNVLQIRLPALREHKVDIPLLVAYFLDRFSGPLHLGPGDLGRAHCVDYRPTIGQAMSANWKTPSNALWHLRCLTAC